MLKKLSISLICTIFLFPAFTVADLSTPEGRIRGAIDQIIELINSEDLIQDVRWSRIQDVIDDHFDFRSISQSVLATNWKEATLGEREKFIEYFTQHLLNTYRGMIESYTDEQIRYDNESIKGDRAVVSTVIVHNSTEIPVNYKLKNNDGTWFAYDVEIEGSSLVNNFRNQYGVIFKNEGMDGLLAHIQSSLPTNTAQVATD